MLYIIKFIKKSKEWKCGTIDEDFTPDSLIEFVKKISKIIYLNTY